jgi:predicted DsbA family dithiol-disulfide isomerase
MNKEKIRIGVVSDVVCPWCYIGKRRLEKAMLQSSDRFDFEVEYFPFELNPHMPEKGVDYREYLVNKFGSESKYEQLTSHVKLVAAQDGIGFNMDLQKISPNTRNAHRIILMAKEEGNQGEVVEVLYKAYFTEGVDLSKTENLVTIAAGAGSDRTKVEQLLNSNTGKAEIEMAEKELNDLGITAVPLFIIDNKLAISGAQSVDAFVQAFEEVGVEKVNSEGIRD